MAVTSATIAAILEKTGNGLVISNVPVNSECLPYYLNGVESQRGSEAIDKLLTLPKKDLLEALRAIYTGERTLLNKFLGAPGEDVMDHIERSTSDVEKIGHCRKRK